MIKLTLDNFCIEFSHANYVWEVKQAIQAGKRRGSKFNRAIDILKREIRDKYTGKSQNFYPPFAPRG